MKIFLDSSILIEYIKGTRKDLLKAIMGQPFRFSPRINHIVYSEFMYHYLALLSKKSPLALKESRRITEILEKHDPIGFVQQIPFLVMDNEEFMTSYALMKKYNMLPRLDPSEL